MTAIEYLHLPAGTELPAHSPETAPYKAVVVVEQIVTPEWQKSVSDWLVRTGCYYMMAWGRECSTWDDSVDWASLERKNYEITSDDDLVMTTWHSDEGLDETLWFAEFCAHHPTRELAKLLLLDITAEGRGDELIDRYNKAIQRTPS